MALPSVGRVVHYVSYGTPGGEYASQCRAAIVTEVGADPTMSADQGSHSPPQAVGLCVQNPTGLFFHSLADGGCAQDESKKAGGTWHWPERVEG